MNGATLLVEDEDRFMVFRTDFLFHNLLNNINVKDVEQAIKGEAILIQGKRQRRPSFLNLEKEDMNSERDAIRIFPASPNKVENTQSLNSTGIDSTTLENVTTDASVASLVSRNQQRLSHRKTQTNEKKKKVLKRPNPKNKKVEAFTEIPLDEDANSFSTPTGLPRRRKAGTIKNTPRLKTGLKRVITLKKKSIPIFKKNKLSIASSSIATFENPSIVQSSVATDTSVPSNTVSVIPSSSLTSLIQNDESATRTTIASSEQSTAQISEPESSIPTSSNTIFEGKSMNPNLNPSPKQSISISRKSKRPDKKPQRKMMGNFNKSIFSASKTSLESEIFKIPEPLNDGERDREWLQCSHHSDLNLDEDEPEAKPSSGGRPAKKFSQDNCQNMMDSFMILFACMKFTGRMPFKIIEKLHSRDIFEFNRGSSIFWVFCCTTLFLTFCCLSMAWNLMAILGSTHPFSFYEDIMALEFDKYWVEAMITILGLYFTCTWSISTMFESGIHLCEYLNRWNVCINVLKYDVTTGLTTLIVLGLTAYGLYSVTLIILFFGGGDDIPTVRGASGFIGLLIFQPFVHNFRVHWTYFILEYVGLLIHLYSILCSGFVILMILAYAKALENAARKFNLRLAFALRMVVIPDENAIYRTLHRLIPYGRLFGEHIVVTSFSRHLGKVFHVAFSTFYSTKLLTMVVTLYAVVNPMLNGFPQFNSTFLDVSKAHGETGVPIRYAEPEKVIMGKFIYLASECWLIALVFSEMIQTAGATIMNGLGFIRRHGFIMCKSAYERRFITSMQNSFAPRNSFYINPGVEINRESILSFAAFALAMFIFLIQFSPSRLKTETSIVCNKAGECRSITYSKLWEVSALKVLPTPTTLPPTTLATSTVTTISTTTQSSSLTTGSPVVGRFSYPPCVPNGASTIELTDFAYLCSKKIFVYTPIPFEKKVIEGEIYYDTVPPPCANNATLTPPLYDCFGDEINLKKRDECGRLKLPTPNTYGEKPNPPGPLVDLVVSSLEPNKQSAICCFIYTQLENQTRSCNLMSSTSIAKVCRKHPSNLRKLYESLLWKEVKVLDIQKPKVELRNWKVWTSCICQALTEVPKTEDDCKSLVHDYPPCDSRFDKTIPNVGEWTPTQCKWRDFSSLTFGEKMQMLYTRDNLLQYTPILVNPTDCKRNEYPSSFDLSPFKPLNCFGNPTTDSILQTTDDCQNLKFTNISGFQNAAIVYQFTSRPLKNQKVFCCYSWNSSLPCNFPANPLGELRLNARCGKGFKSAERVQYEADLLNMIRRGISLSSQDRSQWSSCLCQEIGHSTVPTFDPTVCPTYVPPTTPTTTTTTLATTTTTTQATTTTTTLAMTSTTTPTTILAITKQIFKTIPTQPPSIVFKKK